MKRSFPYQPRLIALDGESNGACSESNPCRACRLDLSFLQRTRKPRTVESTEPALRTIDLFAGCGAMSLGLEEAARRLKQRVEIALAVDNDPKVLGIFERTLSPLGAVADNVSQIVDGELGADLTSSEKKLAKALGAIDVLLGGPPCQGHSDLNNRTRRRDPKNALYLKMARAAQVFEPKVVIIENVVTVQRDVSQVVDVTAEALKEAGYVVAREILDLNKLGVPQRRRRHILLASSSPSFDPASALQAVAAGLRGHPDRTVKWAIHDLLNVKNGAAFDTPNQRSEENRKRMAYLFDHGLYDLPNTQRPECHRDREHRYTSVYGRLRWDRPAQTITTGFRAMGQGRYVHPPETAHHHATRGREAPNLAGLARCRGSRPRRPGESHWECRPTAADGPSRRTSHLSAKAGSRTNAGVGMTTMASCVFPRGSPPHALHAPRLNRSRNAHPTSAARMRSSITCGLHNHPRGQEPRRPWFCAERGRQCSWMGAAGIPVRPTGPPSSACTTRRMANLFR